jgi:hypothetical protein
MGANATRARRSVARMVLAAMVAMGAAGCAKEPPTEAERMSLKDSWANGTTVTHAELRPAKTAYTPPPPPPAVAPPVQPTAPARTEPASPKQAAPAQPTPPTRPTLALSPPKLETPPPVAKPVSPTPPLPQPKALAESDLAAGSIHCGAGLDCVAVLRAMIDDPKQSWMMRAPTPVEFANGTRLFAYRALKTTLECGKLRFANAELDWAIDTFSSSRLEGVDSAHRARVAALAEAVHAEIEGEIKKRC